MPKNANYIFSIAIFLMLSTSACAEGVSPSFNCKKASNKTEKLICSDAMLSIDDNIMSHDYEVLKKRNIEGIFESQLIWLKARNLCEEDKACIEREYKNRKEYLGVMVVKTAYKNGVEGFYKSLNWVPTGVHSSIFDLDNENDEACNEFLKALNENKGESFYVCKVPINNSDFQAVKWVEIDATNNKDLLKNLNKAQRGKWYSESEFEGLYKRISSYKLMMLKYNAQSENSETIYYMLSSPCKDNDPNVIMFRNYAGGSLFKVLPSGEIKVMEGNNPAELIEYKGNLFGYSFSASVYPTKDMKPSDKFYQEVELFGLGNKTYCRFQYVQ